jgi:hypothetical protein
MWIGCDAALSPAHSSWWDGAAFLAEPTGLHSRAPNAGQCRRQAARKAGRIDGRTIGRAKIEVDLCAAITVALGIDIGQI